MKLKLSTKELLEITSNDKKYKNAIMRITDKIQQLKNSLLKEVTSDFADRNPEIKYRWSGGCQTCDIILRFIDGILEEVEK